MENIFPKYQLSFDKIQRSPNKMKEFVNRLFLSGLDDIKRSVELNGGHISGIPRDPSPFPSTTVMVNR